MDIKFIETNEVPEHSDRIAQTTTLQDFIKNHAMGKPIYLEREILSIDHSLYSKDKKSTINIWRNNNKKIIKTYKFLIKLIRWLQHNDQIFDGTFYVNTKNKLNNNDFMLEKMLDLKFKCPHFCRLTKSLEIACDFLKKESNLNNMCDFKENVCINFRNNGQNRTVGCCSKKCKFCAPAECPQKNISCRLFICEFLVNKGYYFDHMSLPIFKQNLFLLERIATRNVYFMSTKTCSRLIWTVRISTLVALTITSALLILGILRFFI